MEKHSKKYKANDLEEDFKEIGVKEGDTILVRASLGAVGRMESKANTFIDALLSAVGSEGTIVSLAFTNSYFIRKANPEDAFNRNKKSYAGALPNAMLDYDNAFRSKHPTCSYVAIGKNAELITSGHDENSPAYEPVRKIIELNGKCLLVGCVDNSPGFTTTHLAEQDLGMLKLNIFPTLNTVYFKNDKDELVLFKRKDPGLCSNSFFKFYAHYVRNEILRTGYIGNAYSIIASAKEAYNIDVSVLSHDKKFNICGSKDCFVCNAGRWDRVHRAPAYILKRIIRKLVR